MTSLCTELLTKDDFFTNSFTTLIHYNKNSCLLLGERENSAEMWITLLPKKVVIHLVFFCLPPFQISKVNLAKFLNYLQREDASRKSGFSSP
jgi:hypothetical protein